MAQANLSIQADAGIGPVRRRLFGGFVEHLGRHVYTGIYEPGHPTADADGFRADVIDLVRELGVSAIRYPGGNFVSGYRWEDGVGPREERPRRLDLAWHSIETNEVGLHEFSTWLEHVGSELMLAVNLGTRGVQEALDLLEYCRIRGGTELSEARRAHGRDEPFDIRMWCLGNEMDGPWQLGHRDADSYGELAARTARAMRQVDPDLELVVCGSSARSMPTFGAWERTVLRHAYDEVDYISCHAYYEEVDGDAASFLASAVDMDAFIEEVAQIVDEAREAAGSDRTVGISFDEWNVWYMRRFMSQEKITDIEHWPVAPRLLEDRYSVLDAVVLGSLLISLVRHADRVTSASLAQLVNVIAPIMTEPGGLAWRQTTFFPFALTSRLAQGEAVDVAVECPSISTERHGDVPAVTAVATRDGDSAAIFAVNRALDESVEVTVDVASLGASRVSEAHVLSDPDMYAANSLEEPERVTPRRLETRLDGSVLTFTLPPVSWVAVSLEAE
ncbi:alpha-N-arabinofuranosidase [Demequina muriae]|uniref:non-reducing end alpha-L-arabinofuranosidase n=1 Tax=Demequina muriae TaxID=3051664 RepID=A0ABT8GEU0_9MICO|nr:alpha-N-arabinofuranosidase [Demequina sp. EGI L300058]MDN4479951.1 alpha-N-arabinofuranosidase [Demequina sp. EGI L300058]